MLIRVFFFLHLHKTHLILITYDPQNVNFMIFSSPQHVRRAPTGWGVLKPAVIALVYVILSLVCAPWDVKMDG